MLARERQNKIVEMVNANGSVLVKELSEMFEVTEDSIRKDLSLLEKKELLKKTYGGAVRNRVNTHELYVSQRKGKNVEEKKKISNGLLTGNGFVYPYMASALCGYAARETNNAELAYQVWQVLIHSLAGKDKKDNFDIGVYKNYFNNENLEEMFWISTNFTSQWCLNVIVALELTKDYIKDSINDYEWADWVK